MATVAFELEKGVPFELDKGVGRVRVGLGWDDTGEGFDPDAHALGLAHLAGGKAVYYGNGSHAVTYARKKWLQKPDGKLITEDGSISHSGDNRTGSGEDSEVIGIDFKKLPQGLIEIAIWVTIDRARARNQNFGMIKNAQIKIADLDNKVVVAEYKLRENFSKALSVHVGSFTLTDSGNWEFTAVANGYPVELGEVLNQYQ